MKQYWFIINPKSGKKNNAKEIKQNIEKKFSQNKKVQFKILFTEKAGHAFKLAEEAVKNKIDIVVAVGGDGTMNEIASGLVHTKTSLGLIPVGSGNGFARSLDIPLKPDRAINLLLQPTIVAIDAGKINGHYFFGVAGVGFDAEISEKFQDFGIRGQIPYFYIGIKEYFKYTYEEFKIISNHQTLVINPLLITIANTPQYGNGAVIAPGADFRDGLFEVCIIEKTPLLEIITRVPSLFNNKINLLSSYSRFQTDKLKIIRTRNEGWFHTDGEPNRGGKELNIKILKNALKVCT